MATSTVTTTSDIPKVLEPFYIGKDGQPGLIQRGIGEIFPEGAQSGREAYDLRYDDLIREGLLGEGAIAGLTPGQEELGRRISELQVPDAYTDAQRIGGAAGAGYLDLQNLQAMGVSAPELLQYQMDAPQMFGMEQMQQYMSPYMQGVVDIQQRNAIDAARQAQLGANLGAARTGTLGGGRQAVLQAMRESGLRQEMGDIKLKGLQSAFENAQQQFERDRAAQLGVSKDNLTAALDVQKLGAGQSLEAQRANQDAALAAARERGAASSGLLNLAQTMGDLGSRQLVAEQDILKTQGAFGDFERAIEQQRIDARRNALMDRANYGMTQIGDLSNLLRGTPLTDTRQTTTTPPPSFASQLTGMGLATAGLYNMSQGGGGQSNTGRVG
jgi:hypothetical protein